jgi:uncharacterized protein (DUF58 family)
MLSTTISDDAQWSGPGARAWRWRGFQLGRFLIALVVPPRGQKVLPTSAGVVLILIALGIGLAAYNTSSNILFIAFSLLLSTLVVSGFLSWMNLGRTAWRVTLKPPLRAGQQAVLSLEVHNHKRFLPTYCLNFDLKASSGDTGRLVLRQRLDPGETRKMEWSFRPRRRGRELVEMTGVNSKFPFGFLHKHFGGRVAREVYVWPPRIVYQVMMDASGSAETIGEAVQRPGHGTEFMSVRRYQQGDSHRHIHWKASARQRKLMVKQLLAENQRGYFLYIETPVVVWENAAQFEQMCSLAASMAEDLFRQGQLVGAVINDGAPILTRRVSDLELLLDQLAVVEPVEHFGGGRLLPVRNVITFEPGRPEGVHAILRGRKAASA